MELVVVLVVLIGLAGIVVAMLPSMITRTHGAAGASNISEVAKWVQTYEALHYEYPNRWDALIKADGSEPELGGTPYFAVNADITNATPLTAGEANALTEAGITAVYHFEDDPDHATFDPYATALAAPTAVASTVEVVRLTAAGKTKLGLDLLNEYVVLGLGTRSSMVGKGIVEAPVHFPDSPTEDPSRYYGRFGVVFKVNAERAFPVAVVAFHGDGLSTAGDHVAEYFESVNNK